MEKHNRIKILRLLNGMTQGLLAYDSKSNRASIVQYEKGVTTPPEAVLKKLAEALCVSPSYLAFGYPHIQDQAWFPIAPGRKQHLKAFLNDIDLLLPDFLIENNYTFFVFCQLQDGGVFLLGRKKVVDTILIASSEIVSNFYEIISMNIKLLEKQSLDKTNDTFEMEDVLDLLHKTKLTFLGVEAEHKIQRRLAAYLTLDYNKPTLSPNLYPRNYLKLLRRIYSDIYKEYLIPNSIEDQMDEFFVSDFEKIALQDSVQVNKLLDSICARLDKLGVKKRG